VKQTDRNDLIFFLIYKPNSKKSPSATEKPIECVNSLDSYKKYIAEYLRDTSAMKLPNGKSVVKDWCVGLFYPLVYDVIFYC
jgi:hypothetical protein